MVCPQSRLVLSVVVSSQDHVHKVYIYWANSYGTHVVSNTCDLQVPAHKKLPQLTSSHKIALQASWQRSCSPLRWLKLIFGDPQIINIPILKCMSHLSLSSHFFILCGASCKCTRANSKDSSHDVKNISACRLVINPLGSMMCGVNGTYPLTNSNGLYPIVKLFSIL